MRKSSRYSTLILLLTLFLVPAAQASSLGKFSLNGDGIDNYKGKGDWLVVMLWASDCPACNQEAPAYNTYRQQQLGKGIEVLGISMDGEEGRGDAEAFVERHKLDFPNLVGEPGQVAALYSQATGAAFRGTPTFLLYSPSGELLAQQAGAIPVKSVDSFIQRQKAK